MSISTRLVLLLTVTVGAVMATASYSVLRSREAALHEAARDEVRAHAQTLQIALEESFAAGRGQDAQRLIDRLGENKKVYGVVLFDERGDVRIVSNSLIDDEIRHPPGLTQVINTREPAEFERTIGDDEVFSVIMPIRSGERFYGAFEIAQPVSFVQNDIRRTRRNFALVTLLLLVTIFLVVVLVLRRSLSRPVAELIGGATAVGQGDLSYRVIVPRAGGEFATLAREFNRMADHLSEQRRAASREAGERLQLERDLRQSERLAAVGRLAAGVAHEMGAPLNVIDARAEQILNKPDAPFELHERNLRLIRKQTARITHIVRQLLTLARPYNLRRAPTELNNLILETLESVEQSAQAANIEIDFELPSEDRAIMVDVDTDFMRQVFCNVLVNAVQAMPAGGRFQVECTKGAAERDGVGFARVRVADTGSGIAPEHLAYIFEPFYTTKDVGSGTGLGLTVSRRIVEEHGGWMEAASNVDSQPGATFTIYLPQCESSLGVTNNPER